MGGEERAKSQMMSIGQTLTLILISFFLEAGM
jgi:hypothetical protein